LSLFSGFLAVRRDYRGALLPRLATTDLTRVPRIQVFCPRGAPVGVAAGRVTQRPHAQALCRACRTRRHTSLCRLGLLHIRVNPCGNFSGTSSLKFRGTKGSIGHTFMVCIHTENQNQGDFYPFVLLEISVLHEPPLGHLRYGLTDVPPQPNSPPDNVFNPGRPAKDLKTRSWTKIQPRFIE
jgi:hypothetical protein